MSEKTTEHLEQNPEQAAASGWESKLNHFFSKLGLQGLRWQKLLPLALVLVLGIALMAISGLSSGKKSKPDVDASTIPQTAEVNATATNSSASQEELMEAKLTKVLGKIQGVGEVTVSLTFAQGSKTEYAVNASTTVRSTEEKDAGGGSKTVTEETRDDQLVMEDNSSRPVAVQQTMPQVQGVLVVAQGADDPVVCTQISKAVESLLGVPLHKIVICPAGKE